MTHPRSRSLAPKVLQAQLRGPAPRTVDPSVVRSSVPGSPLPAGVLQRMEDLFGTKFSDVRVHVGPQAPSIGALAFTSGSEIFFAPGQFNPATPRGIQLLGHELTHVVQQRAGRVRNAAGSELAVVQDPGLEAEAERMALLAVSPASGAPDRGARARTPSVPAGPAVAGALPKLSPSAGPGPQQRRNPVQKKVGFEFQTNWHVEANPWTYGSGGLVNTSLFKSSALIQGVGWSLTSDGGEAEFVTEAFEETDNTRLRLVFSSMIAFINRLKASRNGTNLMPLVRQQGVTLVGSLAALRPAAGLDVLAVPQMTAGIRIDRLRLAMKSTHVQNTANAKFGYNDSYSGVLAAAADSSSRRHLDGSVKYRSVVSLMATYVALAAHLRLGVTSEGVKKITTLMSRSHLGQVFQQTPESQQAQGNLVATQNLKARFVQDVLDVATAVSNREALNHTASIAANLRMIPPMLHKNIDDPSGPTVREQLEGMVDGKDPIRWGWLAHPGRWWSGGASMGNMNVERVGPANPMGQREMGVIVEFRNFQGGLDSGRWAIWAESLMRWIVQVNDPAVQNPSFNWRRGQALPLAPPMPTSQVSKAALLSTAALGLGLAVRWYRGG